MLPGLADLSQESQKSDLCVAESVIHALQTKLNVPDQNHHGPLFSYAAAAPRLFNGPAPVQRATNAFHIPLAELFVVAFER